MPKYASLFMDEQVAGRLRELYGLDPNVAPIALQFPRLPPGVLRPTLGPIPPKEQMVKRGQRLAPNIDQYREMYQRMATGLLEPKNSLIPPGHPLFSGAGVTEALKAENAKLKKENLELKRQIDSTDSENPKHNP